MKKSNSGSKTFTEGRYDYNIGLARVILAILVVVGHSTQFSADAFSTVTGDVQTLKICDAINFMIYTFHMPAYMILNGYLFYMYRIKRRLSHYKLYILQLIMIQITIGWVCNILSYIVNDSQGISWVSLIYNQLVRSLLGSFGNAWYIISYLAFWIYTYIVSKAFKKSWLVLISAIQVLQAFKVISNDIGRVKELQIISDFGLYYIWFVLGIIFCKYNTYSKIRDVSEESRGVYYVLLTLMLFIIQTTIKCSSMQIQTLLCGVFGWAWLVQMCQYTIGNLRRTDVNNYNKLKKVVKYLDKYSFISYVVGYPAWLLYTYVWLNTFAVFDEQVIVWKSQYMVQLCLAGMLFQILIAFIMKIIANQFSTDVIKVKINKTL